MTIGARVGGFSVALLCACNSGNGGGAFTPGYYGMNPGYGPKSGGTDVVIQGTQLTGITRVDLGDTATDVQGSLDRVTCRTSAYSAGAVYARLLIGDLQRAASPSRAFVYDPDTWTRLGGDSAQSGLNFNPGRLVTTGGLASFRGDHYVIWREDNGTATQARVAVYEASDQTWVMIDGGGANGINKNPSGNVEHPVLVEYNQALYAAWTERNPVSSRYQARVAVWNDSRTAPAWTFVDGDGANGLNHDVNCDADRVALQVILGDLLVAWGEFDGFGTSHVHASRYRSGVAAPAFTRIDGGTAAGLNFNAAESAMRPSLAEFGGDLILGWFETGSGVGHVRVAIYRPDQSTPWQFLDGNTANGLNLDPTKDAHSTHVFSTSRALFCTFLEANANGKQQLRVARLAGDITNPQWTFQGGTATAGLNYDPDADASTPHGVGLVQRAYVCWTETVGVRKQVRIAGLDGATREFLGNSTDGINVDPTRDALWARLHSDGVNVFALWVEENANGVYQLRFAKGN